MPWESPDRTSARAVEVDCALLSGGTAHLLSREVARPRTLWGWSVYFLSLLGGAGHYGPLIQTSSLPRWL